MMRKEFAATAESFADPDQVRVMLNAYRSRFLASEERDRRYESLLCRLRETEQISASRSWCGGLGPGARCPAGVAPGRW